VDDLVSLILKKLNCLHTESKPDVSSSPLELRESVEHLKLPREHPYNEVSSEMHWQYSDALVCELSELNWNDEQCVDVFSSVQVGVSQFMHTKLFGDSDELDVQVEMDEVLELGV